MLEPMGTSSYSEIKDSLRQFYLGDPRPWLVGFSGGKDSTMLAALIVEVVAGLPDDQRKKPVATLCTDTRLEHSTLNASSTPTVVERDTDSEIFLASRDLSRNRGRNFCSLRSSVTQ
jgi:NH3-dependent NAD+ synthetase